MIFAGKDVLKCHQLTDMITMFSKLFFSYVFTVTHLHDILNCIFRIPQRDYLYPKLNDCEKGPNPETETESLLTQTIFMSWAVGYLTACIFDRCHKFKTA